MRAQHAVVGILSLGLLAGTVAVATTSGASDPPAPVGAPVELPNGRHITPAGTLVTSRDFPAGLALSPDDSVLFVAGAGEGQGKDVGAVDSTSLTGVWDLPSRSGTVTSTGWLASDPSHHLVYAATGTSGQVVSWTASLPPVPQGTLTTPGAHYAGAVAVSPDGRAVYVTEPVDATKAPYQRGSRLSRIDVATGSGTTVRVGNNPLPVASATVHGRTVVAVGNEGDGTVSVLDGVTLARVATVRVGRHPSALKFTADGAHLVVVSSLDDRVDDISTATWRAARPVSLSSRAGVGAQPGGMAIGPDGRVYVTLEQDNAVAVLARVGTRLRLVGRVPTAWYPMDVAVDAVHNTLIVANAKGIDGLNVTPPGVDGDRAAELPNPGPEGAGVSGMLERIPVPSAPVLAAYSRQVEVNNGWTAPVSRSLACGPRQIKHVVLIVRENKTYDEELGDEPGGDPELVTYPKAVTPNTHAIAERGGLLTALYADEEFSDIGHQALAGGETTDWAERFMELNYGGNNPVEYANYAADAHGKGYNVDKMQWPPSDYLIDLALRKGLDVRNFGHAYRNSQSDPSGAADPRMTRRLMHAMPGYGWDLSVRDQDRAAFWAAELAKDSRRGAMPALEVVYLPDDHTGYYSNGQWNTTEVADNDRATGMIVDALSHSPFWGSSAVFVEEDDSQGGEDHVDGHRTVGAVISPWAHSGVVSTVHHDQASILRTIESLLDLPSLTEVDATATPFYELWTATPDLSPYTTLTPVVPSDPLAVARERRAWDYVRAQVAQRGLGTGALTGRVPLPADVQLQANWLATRGTVLDPNALPTASGIQGSGESDVRVGPVDARTFCS